MAALIVLMLRDGEGDGTNCTYVKGWRVAALIALMLREGEGGGTNCAYVKEGGG